MPGMEQWRDTGYKPTSHVTWLWRSATTVAGEEVSTGLVRGSCWLAAWGLLRLQPGCCTGGSTAQVGGASGWTSVNVTDRFCSAEGTKPRKPRVKIWGEKHKKRRERIPGVFH